MKILLAHNSYQQAGGEDTAVDAEIALLRSHGNEVLVYRRDNEEIKKQSPLETVVSTMWSNRSIDDMSWICKQFQPDIIHAHNTFPLISPSLYWFASRKKIPLIQTLHNFRLLCPQAMFLRNGSVCEDCLGKIPWRAVIRGCYHASIVQSAVVTNMLTTHRAMGTYQQRVNAYIVMNQFCRDKFVAGGLPADRIHIKPNFVHPTRSPTWVNRNGGLFVGRLAEEKGIHLLIQAAERLRAAPTKSLASQRIKIIGTGPLLEEVKRAFKDDYLATKTQEEVFSALHSAQFLVAPSTCYETFGLAAAEAFSCGVPVIGSRHGGLAELITDGVNGLLFTPGDANDLAKKIAWAHANPLQMLAMGRAAYQEYLDKYTPEKNYTTLMAVYQNTIASNGASNGAFDEN